MNDAFTDELTKIAKVNLNPRTWNPLQWKSVQDLITLGTRVKKPKSGFKQGWESLGPTPDLETIANQGTNRVSKILRGLYGQGPHLATDVTSPGIVGVAERASRSGWTGSGSIGKYLPVGGKTQMVVGTAAGIPDVIDAARGNSNKGVAEAIGENAGFAAGGLLTGGLKTNLVSIPATIGLAQMGKRVGRKVDSLTRKKLKKVEED